MYSARQTGEVVRLEDTEARTTVSVVVSAGNRAFEMAINGQNILRFPYASVEEFRTRGSGLNGIPFLAPWANRLDEQAFYANGRRYPFDMQLGNVRGETPIHGFLSASEWQVVEVDADEDAAWVTSRLEFYRNPAWMRQFPFAHTIDMTYRLANGALQVATAVSNLSIEPMPVAIGFHPYFELNDSTRDEWTLAVSARTEWLLAPTKLPTGETEPIEKRFPSPGAVPLKDHDLDHVFSDLVRDDAGVAVMSLNGRRQRVDVLLGPKYRVVLVYAPRAAQGRSFVCFEPMAGITNALNLAEKGKYQELQSIPPGGVWQESFWVRPSGF
jgi:aldose 1-epimerase